MLQKLTLELQEATLHLKDNYLNGEKPSDHRDRDYFQKVKAETEPLFKLIAQWEEQASAAIKNKELVAHPQQIESTRENFELILMHSYYHDVKSKRYMELQQALDYVFEMTK